MGIGKEPLQFSALSKNRLVGFLTSEFSRLSERRGPVGGLVGRLFGWLVGRFGCVVAGWFLTCPTLSRKGYWGPPQS